MIRRLISNLYDLLIFRQDYLKILKEYYFIRKHLFNSIKVNSMIQQQRLYKIVEYAINNIPYYRTIAKKEQIKISFDSIFDDLKKFPVLTKKIIRENCHALHPNLNKMHFKIETSGGTTGEPIKLIQDKNYFLKRYASNQVFDEIGGYSIGDKLIKIWGNEKEIFEYSKRIYYKMIREVIRNTTFQNSFKMPEEKIKMYINEINKKKTKVIIAYVQSIYEIAKYIKQNQIPINKINSIITSAGVLYPKIKTLLEEIFRCRVYNRYGSREVGIIGSSCERSDKIHINMFQQYIEVLDDENVILNENERGNLVITNLTNYGMPLIRYLIGDRGSLNYSPCHCGRGLLRLNNVYGRVVDVFKNYKNDLIDGEYFTHLFYFRDNIKQFQVIQEKIDEIKIKLITLNGKKINPSIIQDIDKKIRLVMGKNCKIHYQYCSQIDSSYSGKFRYTISKV